MKIRTNWMDGILSNDGAAGTGGATPAAPAPAAAAPAAAMPAAAPVSGPAAAAPGAAAAGAPPPAPLPGEPAAAAVPVIYKPEGLPEHMLGKSDQETIDKMKAALDGYRKNASDVPEKPEAYKVFAEVDEAIKPFIETLSGDPLFDRMTEYAKQEGIPLKVFQGMVKHLTTVGAEMGIYEPPLDIPKENAMLTPANAAHLPEADQAKARDQRMSDNLAWLDTHVAAPGRAGLSREAVDNLKAALGDRAYGHQAIEYFRSLTSGGKGPLVSTPAGGPPDAKEDLRRRAALPENTFGHQKFDPASHARLQDEYKTVFGE